MGLQATLGKRETSLLLILRVNGLVQRLRVLQPNRTPQCRTKPLWTVAPIVFLKRLIRSINLTPIAKRLAGSLVTNRVRAFSCWAFLFCDRWRFFCIVSQRLSHPFY